MPNGLWKYVGAFVTFVCDSLLCLKRNSRYSHDPLRPTFIHKLSPNFHQTSSDKSCIRTAHLACANNFANRNEMLLCSFVPVAIWKQSLDDDWPISRHLVASDAERPRKLSQRKRWKRSIPELPGTFTLLFVWETRKLNADPAEKMTREAKKIGIKKQDKNLTRTASGFAREKSHLEQEAKFHLFQVWGLDFFPKSHGFNQRTTEDD